MIIYRIPCGALSEMQLSGRHSGTVIRSVKRGVKESVLLLCCTLPGFQEGIDKVGAATKDGGFSSYCHLWPVQTQDQWPGAVSFPLPIDLGLSRSHHVVLSGTSEMLALITSHFTCSSLCPALRFLGQAFAIPSPHPTPNVPTVLVYQMPLVHAPRSQKYPGLFLFLVYSPAFGIKEAMLS